MKKSDLYENFEKRGGSREKGGGGNEIHAPCACDIYLNFDNNGQISTSLYDKADDFNFAITNFPHRDSNILTVFAYGYIFFLFHNLMKIIPIF